jgi:Leucine-rich repeat (LRR) protein
MTPEPPSPATTVNLWRRGLDRVPDSALGDPDTGTLILAENHLRELPPTIARLRAVRTLDLAHNQLSALPDQLGDLPARKRLDLRWNPGTPSPGLVRTLERRDCVVWF